MKIAWIRETQSKVFIFGLIGSVYLLQFYGLWLLPFMDVDFSRPWNVYFVRAVQTAPRVAVHGAVGRCRVRKVSRVGSIASCRRLACCITDAREGADCASP